MSFAKSKGTSFETQIVNYLKQNGLFSARRVALGGASGDKGDIHVGLPSSLYLVIECKNYARELTYKMIEDFIQEAHTEYLNCMSEASKGVVTKITPYRAWLIVKRVNYGVADSFLFYKDEHSHLTHRLRLGDLFEHKYYKSLFNKLKDNMESDNVDTFTKYQCEGMLIDTLLALITNDKVVDM